MRRLASAALIVAVAACSFDSETPAPYLASPDTVGVCGSTETLFPKLLGFVRDNKLAPLKSIIESRLIPSATTPTPDPSLRALIEAVVRLATGLGLERAVTAVEIADRNETLHQLKPLLLVILRYVTGDLDTHPHYEAAQAGSVLFRTCDADNLLTAIESVLRLPSKDDPHTRWIAALSKDLAAIIEDPTLTPFLTSFQKEGQMGRPAILALLAQLTTYFDDPTFDIQRIRTLLESAVYPAISNELRAKIEKIVDRLAEGTRPEAQILAPLQRAIHCLNTQAPERAALFGLVYDLVASPDVQLSSLLMTLDGLVSPDRASELLDFLADLIHVLREDRVAQKEILGFLSVLFEDKNAALVAPVLLEMVEDDLLGELSDGVVKILNGCGRSPT
ncbi:MAG: hypothetical protein U1E65_12290 [Myxococcota bacterium]